MEGCALDQVVKHLQIISEITLTSLSYRTWLGKIKEKADEVAVAVSSRETRASQAAREYLLRGLPTELLWSGKLGIESS